MNSSIPLRLSVMMFLQYFFWGCWYVTMGKYLGDKLNFTGAEIGYSYNSTALAAMLSPFFVGMVADRFFATEKILAVLHVLGGMMLFAVSQATTFGTFYPLLIGHTLCYMPTLALTNSISFSHMRDPAKEFPRIRVLGTIGWICAGLIVGWLLGAKATTTAQPFQIAATVSLVMGLYCLTLPHTPARKLEHVVTARDVLGLDALHLMRERSFAIFVFSAFLICIPLSAYFSFAAPFLGDCNVSNVASKMTFGQMSEIFFMLIMPWFFARLGVKWMLAVGMFCWGARYVFFLLGYNNGATWPLYSGLLLHGICYDFFFVTAYIYVDKMSPESIRAKAQGFIAFVTLGVGMFVGTTFSGWIVENNSLPNVVPVSFRLVQDTSMWTEGNFVAWNTGSQPAFGKIKQIDKDSDTASIEVFERKGVGFKPGAEVITRPLTGLAKPLPLWNKIWQLPALGSFVILALFALLFRNTAVSPEHERPRVS